MLYSSWETFAQNLAEALGFLESGGPSAAVELSHFQTLVWIAALLHVPHSLSPTYSNLNLGFKSEAVDSSQSISDQNNAIRDPPSYAFSSPWSNLYLHLSQQVPP